MFARRYKATFGQNIGTVDSYLRHRTAAAVCIEGDGIGASAAFFAITAFAVTRRNLPKTFIAIGAMHLLVNGTFYALLAVIAIFVDTIGAELTALTVGITAAETDFTTVTAMIAKVCRTIHTVVPAVFADIYSAVFAQAAFIADANILIAGTAFGTVQGFLVHQTIKAKITAGIAELSASFADTAISADKLVAVAFDALTAPGTEPVVCFAAGHTMLTAVGALFEFQIACITFGTMVIPATISAYSAGITDPTAPTASAALPTHRFSTAAHAAIRAYITVGLVAVKTHYFAMFAHLRAVIASTTIFADIIHTTVTRAAICAGFLLVIDIAFVAVGTGHAFLKMTLKAGVHLVRIASTVAVQTSAADNTLLTGLIVHEACTTVFTNQISLFFDMAVIAEMVRAFGTHTAAGIITLATILTQLGIYTTLPTTYAMGLLLFGTFHTHFTIFAKLCVV